jgi:diacylglycerol O-acyltransferase
VVLPLDVRDPVEMLHAVTTRMEIMKSVRAAELVAIAASCLGATPALMQELFWRGIPLVPLPLPLLNMICTNVPGSPTPLYSAGRRLLASYPHVPTGYELGLGVAMQSYDGKIFFGLTADAHVAPDVGRLRDYIRSCFDQLCKAAAKSAQPRPAKRPKRAKAAEPVEPAASIPMPPAPEPAPEPLPERSAGVEQPDAA